MEGMSGEILGRQTGLDYTKIWGIDLDDDKSISIRGNRNDI